LDDSRRIPIDWSAIYNCIAWQRFLVFVKTTSRRFWHALAKLNERKRYTWPNGIFFSLYAIDICDLKCVCMCVQEWESIRLKSGKSTHKFEISTKRRTAWGLLYGDVRRAETFFCSVIPSQYTCLRWNQICSPPTFSTRCRVFGSRDLWKMPTNRKRRRATVIASKACANIYLRRVTNTL
jgi:hypothetical protein